MTSSLTPKLSPGALFRSFFLSPSPSSSTHLPHPVPLQIFGAVTPYCAMLAERSGARCLYLSGSGVATSSHGLPDLGITDLHDVVEDAKRITAVTSLPLLVDIDTGFGSAFNIQRTIRELERIGVAGVHIEDQIQSKRCGHRPNKQIVSTSEMCDRIKMAVDSRVNKDFVIMARTDSLANEGIEAAISRAKEYISAGADMLFPEALTQLSQYEQFRKALPTVPILANITEFGQTELYTVDQLGQHGVSMILYPLSAFRAMSKAASTVYDTIIKEGTQKNVIGIMQTRKELYEVIGYKEYEDKLDKMFGGKEKEGKGEEKEEQEKK